MNINNFTTLLQQEMTRKEFLLYIGAVLIALTGLSGLIRTISNPYSAKLSPTFGNGPYGGRKGNN
jgi:hypothetical protein